MEQVNNYSDTVIETDEWLPAKRGPPLTALYQIAGCSLEQHDGARRVRRRSTHCHELYYYELLRTKAQDSF